MRFLMIAVIAVPLVACMPTKEEVWDPRDYDLTCDELRDAIGIAVDDDVKARQMQTVAVGGTAVAIPAAALFAPAAIVAAPLVIGGAALAGTAALLKGTESKREAERRRAHLERIFFAKGCVQGAAPGDEPEPSESLRPPED